MSKRKKVHISFVDGEIQEVAVTHLSPNVYRLEWTPVIFSDSDDEELELYLGDTIETQTQTDGNLRFVRVLERSQLQHFSWAVPQEFVNSEEFDKFVTSVKTWNGHWELLMKGWLLVHIPDDSGFDVGTELDRHVVAALNQVGKGL